MQGKAALGYFKVLARALIEKVSFNGGQLGALRGGDSQLKMPQNAIARAALFSVILSRKGKTCNIFFRC